MHKIGEMFIDEDNFRMIEFHSGVGVEFDFEELVLTNNKGARYPVKYCDKAGQVKWWKNSKEGWICFASEDSIAAAVYLFDFFIDKTIIN
jgi:hypothetical protein